MLRIRRYRIFVIGAIVLVLLLLRVSQNAQWEARRSAIYDRYAHVGTKDSKPAYSDQKPRTSKGPKKQQAPSGPEPRPRPKSKPKHTSKVQTQAQQQHPGKHSGDGPKVQIPELKPDPEAKPILARPRASSSRSKAPSRADEASAAAESADAPGRPLVITPPVEIDDDEIPDRETGRGASKQKPLDKHLGRPHAGKVRDPAATSTTAPPAVHWRKMPENFPIAKDDVIPLPTGKPKNMPPVQHSFERAEPAADREKREARLAQVKKEMQRSWNGYRKYAWGHDELEPVTKGFRDPFCGWAATLVDAMDTLWIMGMRDEFEDAYRALDDIDFTTTPYRREIPVFETIIRYLGGLLAAYDVSGGHAGKHPKLLEKALELAEVLMSIFDTPNRMPILYYNWDPEYASQPKRASAGSGVAELGSMTMEFTRLAQLTGEDRYYDAVARIANAFEEWQQRGTALDGIFPQQVDASGCNRSAPALSSLETSSSGQATAIKSPLAAEAGHASTVHAGSTPGSSDKGELEKVMAKSVERRAAVPENRDSDGEPEPPSVPQPNPGGLHPIRGGGADFTSHSARLPDWDCAPQGLTDAGYGMGSYSMGANQDSAYEYFPKQYLLLGGLEPKYKTMHEKVVAATKKYLLYRPMIKDEDRSLLFSASVYARGTSDDSLSYTYEVTHLTCFLGGMFALGGRIFGSAEDVAIGARLADGCVWAYESTPSGLMPESAAVVPCQSVASCPWNQSVWYDHLDPNSEWRESQLKDYEVRKKEWDQEKASILRTEALRAKAEEEARRARPGNASEPLGRLEDDVKPATRRPLQSDDFSYTQGKAVLNKSARQKRAQLSDADDFTAPSRSSPGSGGAAVAGEDRPKTGAPGPSILDGAGAGAGREGAQSPLAFSDPPLADPLWELPPEPSKPQTHEEYVEQRIKRENLPPGYTGMSDRRYILRPEAIESVWYMYRITGDKTWQEKGWRMFQAVIKATRTECGHSAVDNVHDPDSAPIFLNNMESFWMAETLKYFYLLFATPDVISLDDWVLNTEAHPFKRPR